MINKKLKKSSFIVILFFLLSFLDLYIFFKMNTIFTATDTLFHFSRVQEIYNNLKQGSLFTWISTQYFQNTGVGSFIFYPDIFLYIWALFKFVFSPIKAFYMWIGLFIFLTYLISFYAMYIFSKNIRRSLFFSLIYTLVPYHLFLGLWNGTLGEFLAYTFLPLVFVGIYQIFWGDSNRWFLLTIGMSLVLYSHLVSAFIIGLFIFIILIWKILISKSLTKVRLLSFIKAVVFTILTTCPFWFLFYIERTVATPKNSFIVLHDLTDFVNQSINNTIGSNIGLLLLMTILVGLIFIRKNSFELGIYIIGVVLFIASSNIIPYQIFNHFNVLRNSLGLIQMPIRLLSFSSVFLSVTASAILERVFLNFKHKNVLVTLVVLFSFVIFWSETLPQYKLLNTIPELTKVQKSNTILPGLKKVTNANYHYMFEYLMQAGETDYYQKTTKLQHSELNNITKSIILHKCYVNGKEIIKQPLMKANYLKYVIRTSHNATVDLPVVFYKNSIVKINGHTSGKQLSNRGTIKVKVNPGINQIEIGYKVPLVEYILMIVAIFSWISLFIIITKLKFK